MPFRSRDGALDNDQDGCSTEEGRVAGRGSRRQTLESKKQLDFQLVRVFFPTLMTKAPPGACSRTTSTCTTYFVVARFISW